MEESGEISDRFNLRTERPILVESIGVEKRIDDPLIATQRQQQQRLTVTELRKQVRSDTDLCCRLDRRSRMDRQPEQTLKVGF